MENKRLGVRKGTWTKEEDDLLKKCIEEYGEGKWHQVPLRAGLNRCRKSCRLRWLNYLRPNIKRGYFTRDEVDLILRLHKLLGNRWSLIAGRLPGRTANDVKNFWNTHIQKNIKSTCVGLGLGGETEKTITDSNIIRPRPRILSKLRVSGCPSGITDQLSKTNNESPNDKLQPSLLQGEDPNDWTDECGRWWSNLLEVPDQDEDGTPFLFSSEVDHQIKEPILPPRLLDSNCYSDNQDGFSSSPLNVDVWDLVSLYEE